MRNSLKREIHEQILDSTHQIYYKEPKLDPEVKEEANKYVSLSKPMAIVREWLKEQLEIRVAGGIEDIIKAHTEIDSQVKFEDIKTGGYASAIDMAISNTHINDMAKEICDQIYQSTLDNVENEHEIVETMFRTFKEADIRQLYGRGSNLEKLIGGLVSVVLHELTHVIQHSQQYKKGRTSTEYRSYLEPNKEKFHASIGKMGKGDASKEDLRLYRGSPQEIAAFAQEAALNFIDEMFIDEANSSEEIKEFKKEIPKFLQHYVNKQFNDPSNPMEYAVFKRFNKLMYQEVIRYVDELEKRLLKKKRRVNAG
jgi:hypothetical protein